MSDWRWIFWIVGIFAILRVAPVLALAKIGDGQSCPWSSSTQPNDSYRTLPRKQLLFPMINSPSNERFSQTKKLRFHSRTG